jgi:hypothetical protein
VIDIIRTLPAGHALPALRPIIFCSLLLSSFVSFAQGVLKGRVADPVTGEGIFGANVIASPEKAITTDFDGNFILKLENGEYNIKITYVGFSPIEKKIAINNNTIALELSMEPVSLGEVQVVSDIAISRQTPVAFSNIPTQKIQEQLGTQDLPMILNTTPGVYATQQGGGDGDARVSIRGFNQQNVSVLIDGIPMNDMVNGRVFWSNWFGLDNLTKGVQVQRGLGASKLAIPAIGGTMNILTAGIESKRQVILKQEIGNNFNARTTLSLTSGRLNYGWGLTGAISYRRNDGWVDQLYSRMFFYFLKIEKTLGNHLLSLSGFGAPQISAQRDFRTPMSVATFSKTEAHKLGIDTTGTIERGRRYNAAWGYLRRTRNTAAGGPLEIVNTSLNEFHKPVFSLKDFWTLNDKFYISNILYASYGKGGGTQPQNAITNLTPGLNGEQNLQATYDANAYATIIQQPIPGERIATNYLRKNYNDHDWYGFLSTFSWKASNRIEVSGGVDGRSYQGRVYSRIHDLLGGDYILSDFNNNEGNDVYQKEGGLIIQNVHRFVRWGGAFGLVEYKAGWWSAFLNLSGSMSAYKQINYFLPKTLQVGDTTLSIGFQDSISYQGNVYTQQSNGVDWNQSVWKNLNGFTAKGGMNFNLTEKQNVFFNLGLLSRAPLMANVFRPDNKEFRNIKNEEITSGELGYSFRSAKFTMNLNGYYTFWNNRPTRANFTLNGDPISVNATGMQAIHRGLELDFILKPMRFISFEGMASLGDWRWNSIAVASIIGDDGQLIQEIKFDPRGVKVGDAAQHTFAASLRIEPFKWMYIKPQYNYFTHNYANFNPEDLQITVNSSNWGPNVGRQSWRMPDYGFLDISSGLWFIRHKVRYDIRGTVINVLDDFYITDAQNNEFAGGFNAASASVNVGMGRRWTISVTASF